MRALRIVAEGTTTMTGSNVKLCTGYVGPGAKVWVGAGDSNSAGIRVGINTLNLYIDPTDKRGYTIDHDFPGMLNATGGNGDVIRWTVWGGIP